jgi:endonuclease/exonuclease/phosphatase family metal-dependent hydrolase
MRGRRVAIVLAATLASSACATLPGNLVNQCAKVPVIKVEDGIASTDLRVMTYNIEGLPWPVRVSRRPFLRELGRQLARMRVQGEAADIILIQEAFSGAAGQAISLAGYANRVRGPTGGSPRARPSRDAPAALTGKRKMARGEGFGSLLSGGLYILSDYPITATASRPFRRGECAGIDCLAKKGVQWARIQIPGTPSPIDVFNTHLQSRGSAGVSRHRSLQAHRLQVNEVSRFISAYRVVDHPMIFGGDFNMRNSEKRFEHFDFAKPWPLVHRYCADRANGCRVLASWDGDAPWMDTQDLLGFDHGATVRITPTQVETLFDQPWRGRPLADHDALLVTYRLSWRTSTPVPVLGGAGQGVFVPASRDCTI